MKIFLAVTALFATTAAAFAIYPYTQRIASSAVTALPIPHADHLPTATAQQVTPATASAVAVAHATTHPKVEAVFVLDTTGSMGGLIQGAKENIWSIATSLSQATPTPEIKLGLVAFRDRGDDYVTKVVDLSTDLDSVYATLMGFRADGGGDGPESVNQALAEAVERIRWSQGTDAYKVIFLVGDAPPHMDYPNDVKYPETLKRAAARGIVVNTIQAGGDLTTRQEWQRIAQLNQGAYFQVEQGGSALAISTPFDEKIATLSREVDATRMYYGDAAARDKAAAKVAATHSLHTASSAAQAKRAMFNVSAAGLTNRLGDNELVDAVSKGNLDLAKLDKDALPQELRDVEPEERVRRVKENADKRAKLEAQITDLGRQRSEFIARDMKNRKDIASSLDEQIYTTVKGQAAKKGLGYAEAAAH